ncbi:MFS transporter [Pseudomonas sp. GX19020]|uniref:MFS transporter n=1 Tax=Pseudomonadota TaxID=1224 RepID=UPI00089A96BF|nr:MULTISPECIES: MFS transporter [Pseudomonadota]MCL4066123.1 MFS transporter [Pseudomonas sp. GX19020]SEC67046.1 MFS transporter, FSR family, fosmidomycin resistance protein [Rhodobacter sp. 24-YEA-8]
MSTNVQSSTTVETTVVPIVLAVSMGHLLNDLMQSLIPASFPLFEEKFSLSFTQIGLITLVFQGIGSILQPLVGYYTDRRPMPYALSLGMLSTGVGLIALAHATSFAMILWSVALVGLGSAIFHPESSRIARLAAGMRPGFAQSLFQVGGNAGTALGPLAAAFVVMAQGQLSIQLFAGVALAGMLLLAAVGRWYTQVGAGRLVARKTRLKTVVPLPPEVVRRGMFLLILLMMSKFIYSVSFSSYYTFYLMKQFAIPAEQAQVCLFIFLSAVAAGTIIGGPIGDKIGRRKVILWSIFGILPLTIVLPWLPLIPNVIVASVAGLMLASAFPAMVVYAQDLMPQNTGMVAGLLFGLAFGIAAIGAAALGVLADEYGIITVYKICAFLPLIGVVAIFLPNPRVTH